MTPFLRLARTTTALVYLAATVAALAATGLFCLFLVAVKDLPRFPEPIGRINDTPATEIFSADGRRILTIGGRETVALDDVSYAFIQAILATEDHRFWDHRGLNKLRTIKALWVTLFEPGKIQGASTITQQLAKNLFFSFERTYIRKFRELLVALQIEAQFPNRRSWRPTSTRFPSVSVPMVSARRHALFSANPPGAEPGRSVTVGRSAQIADPIQPVSLPGSCPRQAAGGAQTHGGDRHDQPPGG